MKKLILFFFFGALFFGVFAQTTNEWQLTGNANVSSKNFLGTTKCQDLIFKTMDVERMRLSKYGSFVGIGTPHPFATLHLHFQEDSWACDDPGNRDDEDSISTRGPIERLLLQLTTPETGAIVNGGFQVSYTDRDLLFWQLEQGNFFIKGPSGGLTIVPKGDVGIGTDNPLAKLDVNGALKAQSANINGAFSVKENLYNLSLGSATGIDLNYGTSYIGFNATRNNGMWALTGDGAHNGGGVIWTTIFGDLYFATIPSAGGSNRTLTDTQVKNNIKLHITPAGVLKAKEVQVTLAGWPDYVFAKDYQLRPLSELEQFIKENHHLPEIPTEAEVQENGIDLGSMQSKLLLKIEELTLYTIEQQKLIEALEKRLSELENKKGGE